MRLDLNTHMKMALLSAAMLSATAISAAPVLAQPATTASPTAAKAQAFSIDSTPIETLLANPRTKAVVEKTLPGIENHPSYNQFKFMTLSGVAPFSDGAITHDKLTVIQAGLDQINQGGQGGQ
jgi:hypothetical protein